MRRRDESMVQECIVEVGAGGWIEPIGEEVERRRFAEKDGIEKETWCCTSRRGHSGQRRCKPEEK